MTALFLVPAQAWVDGAGWSTLVDVLANRWDGDFLTRLASDGYPAVVPTTEQERVGLLWGFMPLFPLLAHGAAALTGLGVGAAGLLVNAFAGTAAIVAWRRWMARRVGAEASVLALAFFAFFPQSYFFSMAYTEALYALLLGLALLALDDDTPGAVWTRVGVCVVLGALVSLTRAFALAAAGMLLLLRAVQGGPRRREGLLVHAAFLAGTVAAYVAVARGLCLARTGVAVDCYRQAQAAGWDVGRGWWPANLAQGFWEVLVTPGFTSWHAVRLWDLAINAAGPVIAWLAWRRRAVVGHAALATALVPLAAQATARFIRSAPRHLSTTPGFFILLGGLHGRPRIWAPLLVLSAAWMLFSFHATFTGVWQSF